VPRDRKRIPRSLHDRRLDHALSALYRPGVSFADRVATAIVVLDLAWREQREYEARVNGRAVPPFFSTGPRPNTPRVSDFPPEEFGFSDNKSGEVA